MHHHWEMRTKMHHLPDVVGDDFRQAFANKRFVVNNITDEK